MPQDEQEQPFAPSSKRSSSTSYHRSSLSMEEELKNRRPHHQNYIVCGCIAAILLIIVVIILVLNFTIFHIKDPVMNFNTAQIQGLELLNTTSNVNPPPRPINMTVLADVSVKNPNVATFKYSNITTSLYYDNVLIGEARIPAGHAQARRTLRMNVTIDVMVEKFVAIRRLREDLMAGKLQVNSFSSISGRVKVLFVKKDVVVRLNCTMTVNVSNQGIEDSRCKSSVSA